MTGLKNTSVMRWIFILFLIAELDPDLILAYEQPERNSEVNDSKSLNDTVNKTDELWKFDVSIPKELYHCESGQITSCDPSDPYRTIDGSCNNLNHPTWGIVNECYLRYVPASYEGFEMLPRSKNGDPLPLARELTVNIFKDVHRPSPNVSFMFTIYGQTMAHDLSRTENRNIQEQCCEDSSKHPSCIAVSIRSNDPFYSQYNVSCLDLHRTQSCEICNATSREQVNAVTPALDASMVYGTNEENAMNIRTNDGTGKLIVNSTEHGDLLPTFKTPDGIFCREKEENTCYLSGDIRGNQHAFLTGISTYYVREHNRIATHLKKMNPHWKEDKLFQETRRINTAILQCITYKEYLQVLLGQYIMDQFNLTVKNGSDGTNYNSSLRLGVSNEFSTAAFRLHTMIPKVVGTTNIRFKDLYANPKIIRAGYMERIMQGAYRVPSEEYDHYHVDDVTNYMAQRPGVPYGIDLNSIDIQRARDHGLPPYVVMVRFCSEEKISVTTFDDLAPLLMTEEKAEKLKENYAAVEDIDLMVGVQMEDPFPGSVVGPTAACIIAKQFYSTKYGDRFFFEHEGVVPSFTAAQGNP
ncbi:Peroxidase like protein [Argiope bruennichi]|uniref:Peroxidase like protein n=1 Tax=Argiope bruennichi TaxID=94029 RepID=A0A8T0EES2_ARGBR|nr:Peroxidase like protein [Argiope bruennichi]